MNIKSIICFYSVGNTLPVWQKGEFKTFIKYLQTFNGFRWKQIKGSWQTCQTCGFLPRYITFLYVLHFYLIIDMIGVDFQLGQYVKCYTCYPFNSFTLNVRIYGSNACFLSLEAMLIFRLCWSLGCDMCKPTRRPKGRGKWQISFADAFNG